LFPTSARTQNIHQSAPLPDPLDYHRLHRDGSRSTKEIYGFLAERGVGLTPSGLYYHLSELNRAGIIEVSEYREKGGGAPEKVWKLKTRKIVIDLLENGGADL